MLTKDDRTRKKKKIPSKDKWEYCDIIPLFKLSGVNNRQPLLYITKSFVHSIVQKNYQSIFN